MSNTSRAQEFEYRIPSEPANIVQVRPKPKKRGRKPAWRTYMALSTNEDAKRVLWLLIQPAGKVVLP